MSISHAQHLDFAVSLAKRVGEKLRQVTFAKDDFHIGFKGARDLQTEYDLWSENEIITAIKSKYPEHKILGEESAKDFLSIASITMGDYISSGHCWIIDPIDGTTNFAHRIPHYGVSIALYIDGVPTVGVVYDPGKDEMFAAARGAGATLNGQPIQVSNSETLLSSVIASGFPYEIVELWPTLEVMFRRVLTACRDIRRMGAASLDICYVASGRYDGYYEFTLNPWDIAAGVVILKEAGGIIQDALKPLGTPLQLPCSGIACGSGNSFNELLQAINGKE